MSAPAVTDPLITLCLITRDEERLLPACLESVRGVVDEIVVVDSGSTDRTVEIAQNYGATVVHRPWNDDFSAARNAALPHAHGRYVLVLDADERVAGGAGPVIRGACERGGFDLAALPLYNATRLDATEAEILSGAAREEDPVSLSRLVRRAPDLAWDGRIHETIEGWVFRAPRVMITLEAPIVHFGYAMELVASRNKRARDLCLLERAVEEDPSHPMRWIYLARERLKVPDPEGAFEAAERSWAAYEARRLEDGAAHAQFNPVAIASVWAFLLLERRRLDECMGVLDRTRKEGEAHPNTELLAAMVWERRALSGRDPEARRRALDSERFAASAALALRGRQFQAWVLQGAAGFQAECRLATAFLLSAEYPRAARTFERALRERPDCLEAAWGLIEAEADAGQHADALRRLAPLLPQNTLDGWILAAVITEAMGRIDELPPLLAAIRSSPASATPPHRSLRGAAAVTRSTVSAGLRSAGLEGLGSGPPQPRGGPGAGRKLVLEGEAHATAGRLSHAAASFLAATRRDPWDGVAWNDLGFVAHAAGATDAALAALHLALRLIPGDKDTLLNLAAVYDARSALPERDEVLCRARAAWPEDAEVQAAVRDAGLLSAERAP